VVVVTLVDTTLLVDLMRADAGAVRWLDAHEAKGWPRFVSAVSVMEVHRGMSAARRPLQQAGLTRNVFRGMAVLPVDTTVATLAGQIDGALRRAGTPIQPEDCLIAATAEVHDLSVTTRNVRDFEKIQGLQVQTY